MSCYMVVDGRSLAVSRDELRWLTEALPGSKLARDLHSQLGRFDRQAVTVTVTDNQHERSAIREAAAAIREHHPISPSVFVMQELERLLER
jgi:hypothetical protein